MIHCNNCNATFSEQNISDEKFCRFCKETEYTLKCYKQKFIQFLFKEQRINIDQIDQFNIDGLLKKDLEEIYNYISNNMNFFIHQNYKIDSIIKFQEKIQNLIKNKSF